MEQGYIGFYSIGMGFGTKAKGNSSIAGGNLTSALGLAATAFGTFTIARGDHSLACGLSSIASGNHSTAFGNATQALGINSTALGVSSIAQGSNSLATGNSTKSVGVSSTSMGHNTRSNPFASVVLGQFNDTSSISGVTWNLNDPVFIIGNGLANNDRKNAMTVLKNGKTGINTITPDAMLHVSEGPGGNIYNSAAEVIIEDDAASYLQFSNPNTFESGILSGNNLSSLRSAIIFRADSSVQIRAGGGNTRLHVRQDGNVGIGTITPQRLLHVSGGAGGNVYHGNSDLIIEDNDATYLQFSSLTADESGILS
ncbi:MAG: hypothetical protein ABIQ02_01900, partial [Saprospiraceae bacterium]